VTARDSEARDLAERAWDGASEALRVASRAESTAASLGGKLDGVERSVDELRGELRSRDAARLAAEERRGRATVAWIGAAAVVVASAIGLVGTLASSRSSEAELASQADVIRRAINQDRETRAAERRQEAHEVAQEALRLRDQQLDRLAAKAP